MDAPAEQPPNPARQGASAPLESLLERSELPALDELSQLLARARAGDREAVGLVLERCQGRLRRIVRVRLGAQLRQHVESMDIVNEVELTAFQKLSGADAAKLDFSASSDVVQWLAQIAINRLRDQLAFIHAQRRDVGREIALDDATASAQVEHAARALPSDDSLPEERAWRKELRELLDDTVSQLPDEYREVILLRDYANADWPAVATGLGDRTVPAAKQLHQRAWTRVRSVMRPKLLGLL